MHHGGELQHWRCVLLLQPRVVVLLPDVACGDETQPVGDTRPLDRSLVAMRLGYRPRGHESARAPTEYGQPVGIGPALRDCEIGGAVHIAIGAIAEMLIDGHEEIGTVTR